MKVYIASDHAGFHLKSKLVETFSSDENIELIDLGPSSDERVDYPDYAAKVAQKVSTDPSTRGILICGSGIGVSIVANKFKQVRAALCTSVQLAKLSRQHNDSNILCLGERILKEKNALMIVDAWLRSDFEAGRHQMRVEKIHQITEC